MARTLALFVCFHDGRYHGQPEWPPSPARLFQALVAAGANGGALPHGEHEALAWLEQLAPPVIAAPPVRAGRGFRNYVPNNDLDAVGGDPRRVAEIRSSKFTTPLLFESSTGLLYAWQFEQGEDQAGKICAIAERLYQLGRGIDLAWAWGEVMDAADCDARLAEHGGAAYRPAERGGGLPLPCPQQGSLQSLEDRFRETRKRFTTIKSGGNVQQLFSQAPKPRFAVVSYNSPPRRCLFELRSVNRESAGESAFAPWPLTQTVKLVEAVRNRAAKRLEHAYEQSRRDEDRANVTPVFGLRRDATEADKAARIRIVPLPSIGSPHVTLSIRRVLVEVPPNCPLSADDIAWSFSAVDLNVDDKTGEILGEDRPVLQPAGDWLMLGHYSVEERQDGGHRIWRTVTAAALPLQVARRRIDPGRLRAELQAARGDIGVQLKEAKASRERMNEESRAAAAVVQALRHSGVGARADTICVQREPFEGKGARAEAFADGTRFAKERLWHVEVAFAEPVTGPVVIGDGRYLGLGVMAPLQEDRRDLVSFQISPQAEIAIAQAAALVHAARRALMALSRDNNARVPRLFSGHEHDGRPARSGRQEHIFLAADDTDGDSRIDRLIIAAPWACDHWGERPSSRDRALFDRTVSSLVELRAGCLGVIALGSPASLADRDPLIGPARVWESRTRYRATRHGGRRKAPATVLVQDVITECLRRGLPRPEVEILEFSAVPNGGGLAARARLHFAAAVRGPLLLGRDSHQGGGVFAIQKEK